MITRVTIKTISADQTWPLRHSVMWPDKPLDYIKLPHDEEAVHYGLFIDTSLTSVISLFINGGEAQFRKFATDIKAQGKGYGSQLLTYLLEQAQSKGIQRLWCNARLDKASYYERFGMKRTQEQFSKGGKRYVIMELHFDLS